MAVYAVKPASWCSACALLSQNEILGLYKQTETNPSETRQLILSDGSNKAGFISDTEGLICLVSQCVVKCMKRL